MTPTEVDDIRDRFLRDDLPLITGLSHDLRLPRGAAGAFLLNGLDAGGDGVTHARRTSQTSTAHAQTVDHFRFARVRRFQFLKSRLLIMRQ